jgi:hypothetical protein
MSILPILSLALWLAGFPWPVVLAPLAWWVTVVGTLTAFGGVGVLYTWQFTLARTRHKIPAEKMKVKALA